MSSLELATDPTRGSAVAEYSLSGWNFSRRKRVLDFVLAALAVIVTLPIMLLIAVAVRLSSPGPVLFRQRRVGPGGKLFEILKFRSMFCETNSGPGITRGGDRRITKVGRILRKTKLDELPQLFNVLDGQMSLVGPRPELPEYYATLPPQYVSIVRLSPGITGWATLHFRNEEELLARVSEEQMSEFYLGHVLPEKARLALEYAGRATFRGDVIILLRTALRI